MVTVPAHAWPCELHQRCALGFSRNAQLVGMARSWPWVAKTQHSALVVPVAVALRRTCLKPQFGHSTAGSPPINTEHRAAYPDRALRHKGGGVGESEQEKRQTAEQNDAEVIVPKPRRGRGVVEPRVGRYNITVEQDVALQDLDVVARCPEQLDRVGAVGVDGRDDVGDRMRLNHHLERSEIRLRRELRVLDH